MNILAFETSSSHLSVALALGDSTLIRAEVLPNGGSERVLPWVHELLAEAGLNLNALDGIAFGAGPGGFTGLRLACGVAQGLAYGLDLPLIGVSTLEALALNAAQPRVLACIDARMNEVYVAAYAVNGVELECLMAPLVLPPAQLVAPAIEGLFGAGDGFATYAEVLGAGLPSLVGINPKVYPSAEAVLRLAAPKFARGEGMAAELAAPLYVRDKVALTTAERLARGGVR